MITVKHLKELLNKIPEDAMIVAYDSEDTGLSIYTHKNMKYWWIRAKYSLIEDNYTEGFDEK